MVRVGLPGWRRGGRGPGGPGGGWDLEGAAADPAAVLVAGGLVAAALEARVVLQWAAIPGWDAEAVGAVGRTGKGVQTRWRSGTGGATRAPCTTGMRRFSLDNSLWDARSYSVTGAAVNKPAYANGRGSIMFGGPLRIPKLVSASKRIMFTFDYQVQRNRTGVISDPVNMPTALERIGDFSQSTVQGAAVTIYDPTTGSPFPGNRIPVNRISAASTALLQYFPNPNLLSADRNYQTSWSGRNNSQNINSRISNIKIGSKDTINGGIGYQGSSSITPNLFQFIDTRRGARH